MTREVYAPGKGGGVARIGAIKSVKCLVFSCVDGAIYALPLKYVADVRAKHYAEKDPDTTYQDEFDFVMRDPYEGLDWFYNQQDPEDFTGKYQQIQAPIEKTIEERIAQSDGSIGYQDLFVPKEEELTP